MTYTRCRINTNDPPDGEYRAARNMWRVGIHIHDKRIVHQIGYLKELNRDARSTKHKKNTELMYYSRSAEHEWLHNRDE
jgi:hypothetical protein